MKNYLLSKKRIKETQVRSEDVSNTNEVSIVRLFVGFI